tara:strand:- start:1266 stop:1712 length:447 start_codon:yes stop_codon:yes gene_type:complete
MARINAYPSSSTINASDTVIGTNSQNLRTENYTLAQIGQVALGYTSYTAILNQSGLAAPVPTVLKNDTGKTFTWIYQNLGEYVIEADSNIFNASTTLVFGNIGLRSKAEYFRWRVTDPIKIEITAFDKDGNPADDVFENGSFEIRIYS